MPTRRPYPDDLTDGEWRLVEPLLRRDPKARGRLDAYGKREMLNAILYVFRTGCSWRHLPHDFPPRQTVYGQFRRWKRLGTFERLYNCPRGKTRQALHRNALPSAGAADSQSIKTADQAGVRGYDGAKKVKGRKRHILVDTQGFLLEALVSGADLNDRQGPRDLAQGAPKAVVASLKKIWADQGYVGHLLKEHMRKEHRLDLEVVERPPARVWVHESEADEATLKKRGLSRPAGFHVLPHRWVVERTFAWISKYRRMSKDYEALAQTSRAAIFLVLLRTIIAKIYYKNLF